MITKKFYDRYDGRDAYVYELDSGLMRVGVSDFGATVQYMIVPAPEGERSVCLGFDSIAERLSGGTYCGATIGRVANRIAGAEFSLGGRTFRLDKNDGNNCLHSGRNGFDRRFFDVGCKDGGVEMTILSPDGDQGFGGNMRFKARFELVGTEFRIIYSAVCDQPTPFSPTCHAYFNLRGEGRGDISDTLLYINSENYTPAGAGLIPTGEILPVRGTPLDFTSPMCIGDGLKKGGAELALAGGYDHNYVLRGGMAARAECDGVVLELGTNMPGLQFYSGNALNGNSRCGKLGPRDGFAFEPQFFPNAINTPKFPSPVIDAGREYRREITYKFLRR